MESPNWVKLESILTEANQVLPTNPGNYRVGNFDIEIQPSQISEDDQKITYTCPDQEGQSKIKLRRSDNMLWTFGVENEQTSRQRNKRELIQTDLDNSTYPRFQSLWYGDKSDVGNPGEMGFLRVVLPDAFATYWDFKDTYQVEKLGDPKAAEELPDTLFGLNDIQGREIPWRVDINSWTGDLLEQSRLEELLSALKTGVIETLPNRAAIEKYQREALAQAVVREFASRRRNPLTGQRRFRWPWQR